MFRPTCLALFCSLGLSSGAAAQSFSFSDFSNVTGLVFNGDAAQATNVLRVTPAAGSQEGAAYWDQPVTVSSGFETTFEFQISNPAGGGADGMTFIIQNDPVGLAAIGDTGTALGYSSGQVLPAGSGIFNSLVVEIDTWPSPGDTSDNEISVHTRGTDENLDSEVYSLGNFTPATDMSDGAVHTMRISYSPGTLDIYLDDLSTPVLSVTYDFSTGGTHLGGTPVGGLNLMGGTSAFVGFTGATGGSSEDHDILSWEWGGGIGSNLCLNVPNSAGAAASISASGSTSVGAQDITLIAMGCPRNVSGIFFLGTTQTLIPFGDGFRCIALPISRIPPFTFADMNGVATRSLDFAAPYATTIQPGVTVTFQYWYRDAVAMMSGFNLTDAIEIPFVP